MADDSRSTSEKLAANVSLILISRAAMIVATLALPVAGWFLNRAVSTMDTINLTLIDASATIKLIQLTNTGHDKIISDHEGRIRTLETYARAMQPSSNAVPR